jgi:hypothetical protein
MEAPVLVPQGDMARQLADEPQAERTYCPNSTWTRKY